MINRTQEEIMQKWPKGWTVPLASIRCMTFNHEPFIAQALDSFLMQETNFPFEIVVHDDASTDNTVRIIKEYEKKYPKLINAIYEKENQYSKHNGSLARIVNNACNGKYWALCEGDDYWIAPNKLQMQVDWLKEHPDYTMCCSDAVIESPEGVLDWHRYEKDCDIPVKDMILGDGGFVQTATLTYRADLLKDYPDECRKCYVGDYPLQLWAVLNGKVRYFSSKTASYRFLHKNSWSSNQIRIPIDLLKKNWQTIFDLLNFLDFFSGGTYTLIFKEQKENYLHNALLSHKEHWQDILNSFPNFEKKFIKRLKIEGFLFRLKLDFLAGAYYFTTKKQYKKILLTVPVLKNIILYIYFNVLKKKR